MNILPNDAQQGQPYDHSKDDQAYQSLLAEFPALRGLSRDRREFAFTQVAKAHGITQGLLKRCFNEWLDITWTREQQARAEAKRLQRERERQQRWGAE